MTPTVKRAIAVVCGLAAAATWVPTLLHDDADAPKPNPDIPAEAGLVVPSTTNASAGTSNATSPNDAHATASSPNSADADDGAESSPGAPVQKSSTEELLARLASSWSDESEEGVPVSSRAELPKAEPNPEVEIRTKDASEESQDEEVPEDPADVFLREHPLRGAMIGAAQRTALFGEFIVREGDVLAGGALRVHSIDARSVVLHRGDAEVVVPLTPFRSNPPRTSSAASMAPRATPTAGSGSAPMPPIQVPSQTPAVPTTSTGGSKP